MNFFKGCSLCYGDAIYPAIFISVTRRQRVRVDIGKHDFRSVLLHPMLSNVNQGHHVEIKLNVM